jgi:anti-sigma B factor antagonist
MKIAVADRGRVSVLTLQGDFVIGPPETAFEQAIREILSRRMTGVVVDFGSVRTMDSSGIEALISSLTSCTNAGVGMKLARVGPRVRRLFEITRLDSILDIREDVEAAVGSF